MSPATGSYRNAGSTPARKDGRKVNQATTAPLVKVGRRLASEADGELTLSIPRDRHGRFDPSLIAKYRRRFPGFDDKIIALSARGMSTRDIHAHVREIYGIEVSPDLVSAVTDQVIDEVTAWQTRPLEASYALVCPPG